MAMLLEEEEPARVYLADAVARPAFWFIEPAMQSPLFIGCDNFLDDTIAS